MTGEREDLHTHPERERTDTLSDGREGALSPPRQTHHSTSIRVLGLDTKHYTHQYHDGNSALDIK